METFLYNLVSTLPEECVLQNYKKSFKIVKRK